MATWLCCCTAAVVCCLHARHGRQPTPEVHRPKTWSQGAKRAKAFSVLVLWLWFDRALEIYFHMDPLLIGLVVCIAVVAAVLFFITNRRPATDSTAGTMASCSLCGDCTGVVVVCVCTLYVGFDRFLQHQRMKGRIDEELSRREAGLAEGEWIAWCWTED